MASLAGAICCLVPGETTKLMAQLRRGFVQYCVLALLSNSDSYGFELTRALTAADRLVTSEGTVYPLLARLRQVGLVETRWQESSQGPPRRYYGLTGEGHRALHAFTTQWLPFRDAIDQLVEEAYRGSGRQCDP